MGLFSFLYKKKDVFTNEENHKIVQAIREAEKTTSGEIRIFIESRCSYVDAINRAAEIFYRLEMDETKVHNAVLLYIAIKDHQLAIFADEGIHKRLGEVFWKKEVQKMISEFNRDHMVDGIIEVINDIGEVLKKEFPYNNDTDKNELPDAIIFGK